MHDNCVHMHVGLSLHCMGVYVCMRTSQREY